MGSARVADDGAVRGGLFLVLIRENWILEGLLH